MSHYSDHIVVKVEHQLKKELLGISLSPNVLTSLSFASSGS